MPAVDGALAKELLQAMDEDLSHNSVENTGSHALSEGLVTETTHLLPPGQASQMSSVVFNPKDFVVGNAEGIISRLAAPLLSRLADAERYSESYDYRSNWMMGLFLELYILFFNTCSEFTSVESSYAMLQHLNVICPRRNIQEHSLAVAPTISAGHLSTTALSATALATLFTNITGFSVIRGLTR